MYCFWTKNIPGKPLIKGFVFRVITFASGFHSLSEFNIRYFNWDYQPLENLNLYSQSEI